MQSIQTSTNTIGERLAMPPLPNELFLCICDKLQLTALSALAQVSRCCHRETGFATLWRELCSKAKIQTITFTPCRSFLQAVANQDNCALLASAQFFANKIYIAPQIDRAHRYLNDILTKDDQGDLEEKFKAHVQLAKARLQVDSPSDSCNDEECLALLSEIIANEQASPEDSIEADFLQALMSFKKRHPSLTDNEADQIFHLISKNEQAPSSLRCRSDFIRASLCFLERTYEMTKDQADNLFAAVSQNPDVANHLRILADLRRATMRCLKDTSESSLSDLEADRLLISLKDNASASINVHVEADYCRGLLRHELRIDSLTDQEADQLLLRVIESKHATSILKARAELIRTDLRLLQRTCTMTDEQADQLLLAISQNKKIYNNLRAQADFMRASFRCQLRTDSMTDEAAYQLLLTIGNRNLLQHLHLPLNLPDALLTEAALLRAELHCQKRISAMETERHYAEIANLIAKPLPADIIARATLMLGKLQLVQGYDAFSHVLPVTTGKRIALSIRGSILTELKLLKLSENNNLPLHVRVEADLLRVRFRLQGLTTSLSEGEVGKILQEISQNLQAPSALRAEADGLIAQIQQAKVSVNQTDGWMKW